MRTVFSVAALAAALGCYHSNIDNVRGIPTTEVPVTDSGLPGRVGPQAREVVIIADQMVRSLLGNDVIASAPVPPTIVLLEVINNSSYAINADIFLNRLRAELNRNAAGNMIFLARERLGDVVAERQLRREQGFSTNPYLGQNAIAGGDYFLTGEISSLRGDGVRGSDVYMLYQFQLIDTETSAIVWEDYFEIRRVGQDDAVYR